MCSRCGGSTVFKGQTLQKSIPRPTPNDNVARKRKKSLPAPSPEALFRPRAGFWSIFGFRPGPKNHQNFNFHVYGWPRSALFRRSCSKYLLKALRTQKDTENHRKVIENCLEIDRKSWSSSSSSSSLLLFAKIKHNLRRRTGQLHPQG